jgi:hypothetical protein
MLQFSQEYRAKLWLQDETPIRLHPLAESWLMAWGAVNNIA